MSGMYWGLTALYLLDRLGDLDQQTIIDWVLSCRNKDCGGFGSSPRNDPHLLYTLSAVQILALYDRLDLLDADQIAKCKWVDILLIWRDYFFPLEIDYSPSVSVGVFYVNDSSYPHAQQHMWFLMCIPLSTWHQAANHFFWNQSSLHQKKNILRRHPRLMSLFD
jgi:hypothetical protein